jgi:hypothetical protein
MIEGIRKVDVPVISWPTEVTEDDRNELSAYLAEDLPLEFSVDLVINNETEQLKWHLLRRLKAQFGNNPDQVRAFGWRVEELCGLFKYSSNSLRMAKELEYAGVEIPTLIPKIPRAVPLPAEQEVEMEQMQLAASLMRWEIDLKRLSLLKRVGPLGFIDQKASEYLLRMEELRRNGKEGEALEKGRVRFHQLYTAV